jgi:chromosome segregation ATPase
VNLTAQVGVIGPGLTLDRRAALVSAARSRGVTTRVDEELAAARQRLETLEVSTPEASLEAAKRRVAATESTLEAKRERVAMLRGRMQEATDEGVAAEYQNAIRALSELETEHAAARERLAEVRGRARSARDTRERRLQLEDRIANLERTAREECIGKIRPRVDEAMLDVPGSSADSFTAADPVTAALAVVHVGRVHTPVVLACRRFPDAAAAESWLAAPVVRL